MLRSQYIKTTAALALAVGMIPPPVASAMVDNPVAASQTASPRPAVRPNPDQSAAAATAATQTASARPAVRPNPDQLSARSAPDGTGIVSSHGNIGAAPLPSSPPAQIVKVSQPTGFAWDDAGIGAGAVLGLILTLLGSTLYLTRHRTSGMQQS